MDKVSDHFVTGYDNTKKRGGECPDSAVVKNTTKIKQLTNNRKYEKYKLKYIELKTCTISCKIPSS
jgi:hypothetical protein